MKPKHPRHPRENKSFRVSSSKNHLWSRASSVFYCEEWVSSLSLSLRGYALRSSSIGSEKHSTMRRLTSALRAWRLRGGRISQRFNTAWWVFKGGTRRKQAGDSCITGNHGKQCKSGRDISQFGRTAKQFPTGDF